MSSTRLETTSEYKHLGIYIILSLCIMDPSDQPSKHSSIKLEKLVLELAKLPQKTCIGLYSRTDANFSYSCLRYDS